MRKSYVTVYDVNMKKVAMLENATNIGYEMPLNSLWKASFDLPLDDPKNEHCRPFYFVEIFDGNERVELFRILPSSQQRGSQIRRSRYQCEHVLATLIDDVLFQHHTVGNLGFYTHQVLQYILDRQSIFHWQLGEVEFLHQFEYTWENSNLLGALFSVPKPFVDDYMWTWDTTTYPWTINLVRPSVEVQAYIRYGRNMRGITKDEDPTNLVNRIFALGYGEGVNQLTFADINDGKPYIEDAASISKYGLKSTVWVDRRFQSPETLKARAEVLLNELKEPRVSYTVQASELYALTNDPIDKFKTGAIVRVQDPDIGEALIRVVNVKKKNIVGAPGDVQLEIANRPQDIAGAIADLQSRMRINEVYAQGATNLNAHDFADNCDPDHPAVMRFWIPKETARINKIMLSYQVEPFRAYSRAIAGGGAIATTTEDGGGVNTTTAAGGSTIIGAPATTSESENYDEVPLYQTGGVYGGYSIATTDAGGHFHILDLINVPPRTDFDGNHAHFLADDHTHYQNLIPHTHGIPAHFHEIPDHVHELEIEPHTHNIHLPDHTHDIEHGIFLGPTPTSVTVKVDGNVVSGLGTSVSDVDIIPYLSKDGSGKVQRGTWHTIEIAPNSLGRIVANVISQIFVQSRGGGDY